MVGVAVAVTASAEALKRLISAFEGIVGLAGRGVDFLDRQKARHSAADLDRLHFPPGGMLRPLNRIADGDYSEKDFDDLARLIDESADEVNQSASAIQEYRLVLMEHFGAVVGPRLEALLEQETDFGKFKIRYKIAGLVSMYWSGIHGVELQSALKLEAGRILKMIDEFTVELLELQDLVFKIVTSLRHERK